MRKPATILLLWMGLVCCAFAQNASEGSYPLGHWSSAVFIGGGTGLVDRTNVQMLRAGVRFGRVFSHQRRLGSFEIDSEVTPFDLTLWRGYEDVYSVAINPLVFKWNLPLKRNGKISPFVLAQAGMLVSSEHIPPGDTSNVNFTTGPGIGMHIFTRSNRTVTIDMRAVHLSNASLGNHNPGINASLQFSLAYTWLHR